MLISRLRETLRLHMPYFLAVFTYSAGGLEVAINNIGLCHLGGSILSGRYSYMSSLCRFLVAFLQLVLQFLNPTMQRGFGQSLRLHGCCPFHFEHIYNLVQIQQLLFPFCLRI